MPLVVWAARCRDARFYPDRVCPGRRSVFGIDRTPNVADNEGMDAEALTIDAFAQLGITVERPPDKRDARDPVVDLVLVPAGRSAELSVKRRSLVSDHDAETLLEQIGDTETNLFVVADRVTAAARDALRGRAGFLDLRGHLSLHLAGLVVEAEVRPVVERRRRTDALSSTAGLEVATEILMNPHEAVAVRPLARALERSPSTVSEILAALRVDGLLDASNTVVGTDLFWQVADEWTGQRVHIAQVPPPGDAAVTGALRLGLEDAGATEGWALTDSAAAASYGAPIALRADQPLDFYVPDRSIIRRATTLLGAAASPRDARMTLRVAPVQAVVRRRVDDPRLYEWPLAHPLFVALDLAQDHGRGREILDQWTPDGRWNRVW